jgi:hypothetical protein
MTDIIDIMTFQNIDLSCLDIQYMFLIIIDCSFV